MKDALKILQFSQNRNYAVQGSHAVLKILICEIGFPDLEKVFNLAKVYKSVEKVR